VKISAINGVPIAHHQGAGTLTDLAIADAAHAARGSSSPNEIISLMRYPEAPSTRAEASHWNQIELVFAPERPAHERDGRLAARGTPRQRSPRLAGARAEASRSGGS